MTKEEAIKHLMYDWYVEDGHLSVDARDTGEFQEAIGIAITALHVQQEPAKLDRSRWKGCNACSYVVNLDFFKSKRMIFCPYCGRPLTEEAWAELERKIVGERGNKPY